MDNPLALFWDCKNSPSLYEMDHKCPRVLALELFDGSGLSWLIKEINRLMLEVLNDVTIIWNIIVGVGH